MAILNIHLFGKFSARCNEQVICGLETQKVQELFCYLLLYRHRPHPRETLASLLWDNTSTAQSKAYFRKALWQLQMAIDAYPATSRQNVLLVDSDWVQINPCADLWLDVAYLERAFTAVNGLPGEQMSPTQARDVEEAVQLYRSDLLDGWYQDWCLYERERLQNIYLSLLNKLMGYCENSGAYEQGLTYGALILRYDRAREQTHRRLMRLHFLSGDRTTALRQYERCVEVLDEELGVTPTELTLALKEQIKHNCLDHSIVIEGAGDNQLSIATPLAGLLNHLEQFQEVLTTMHQQVRQDIQIVKDVLRICSSNKKCGGKDDTSRFSS